MSPWEDAVRAQLANDRAEYLHWKMQIDYITCARCGFPKSEHHYNGACYGLCGEFIQMTITIAIILKDIEDALAWRGPSGKAMGHVCLTRDEAQYLRDWAIKLCMERDELLAQLDANKK